MPRYRADLESIPTYDPGKPIAEVARDLGIARIAEMASNECPTEPFPEVRAAIAAAAGTVHRYPETNAHYLVEALAAHHGIDADRLWVAPGSSGILSSVAIAATGPGTSVVFANPSFLVYGMVALIAGAEPIAVPLDGEWRHDPEAMAAAVRDDTNVLFFCNPNNPTGTHSPAADVDRLIDSVPDRVTIVVDEAYFEYVDAAGHASAVPLTMERDNVIVTRTFSKVYGLAGMRVGYAIGDPGTIGSLRRPQPPYATTALAQVAAIEALRHQDLVAERVAENAAGRRFLTDAMRDLGESVIDSQTNFILWEPGLDPGPTADALLEDGVIVRPMGPWIRITVGTTEENQQCISAIDGVTQRARSN